MITPPDLLYTADHEWLKIDGDDAVVGVTTFATSAMGDVVYLDLPEVGATVTHGAACGEIESTKSVSELYAPADGEVTVINDAVLEDPSLVNSDPFGDGWLFRMTITDHPDLLDADRYTALTSGDDQ